MSYPPARMPRYAYPINTLGEMICLGCGYHMTIPSHGRKPLVYCSKRCKARVERHGGRLTREMVAKRIALLT